MGRAPEFIKKLLKPALSAIGAKLEQIPRDALYFSSDNHQIFFGYYDISPFSADDRLLLACRAPPSPASPHGQNPSLELGYYDLGKEKSHFIKFGETTTWNWQQGCRLQWLDQDHVIYNTIHNDILSAAIHHIGNGKIIKYLKYPVYSVSPQKNQALSLDFQNLHRNRPGYGYDNPHAYTPCDDIILLDLLTDGSKTLFTMTEARSFMPKDDMKDAAHYFNHLCFSPDGRHFMVTHLWVTPQGKRRTRILVVNIETACIACPDNSGCTSHYCWQGNRKMLIFHVSAGHRGRYILYNLDNAPHETVAGHHFNQDGHPTLDEDNLLTDTYPDRLRRQHLMIYNRAQETSKTLAKIHTPTHYTGELRCDLHPRLSRNKEFVCIDAVRNGKRAMILLNLNTSAKET